MSDGLPVGQRRTDIKSSKITACGYFTTKEGLIKAFFQKMQIKTVFD